MYWKISIVPTIINSSTELSDYSSTRCFNGSICKATSSTTLSVISSKTKMCTVRFATPTTSAFTSLVYEFGGRIYLVI
ncbi:hypothetical protein SDJN02_13889, partial [Cucurbita argyrosperma subsp. argyrosperma]